jgi:hypothetical protein
MKTSISGFLNVTIANLPSMPKTGKMEKTIPFGGTLLAILFKELSRMMAETPEH